MARASFIRDAKRYPTDYDENLARATACEMLARRIVHQTPADMLQTIMSSRYQYTEPDGDKSCVTPSARALSEGSSRESIALTTFPPLPSSRTAGLPPRRSRARSTRAASSSSARPRCVPFCARRTRCGEPALTGSLPPPPRPQAQHVVSSLWKGEWVQRNNDNDDIDYVEYDRKHDARASFGTKFATHFNPQRLGVPRYQNICASPRRPWPSPACACSR